MEKKYKVEDIKRLLTEANTKFVCLEDSTGQRIIPFNQITTPFNDHLKRICDRLKAEVLPDGKYFVCFGESSAKGAAVSKIAFFKGEVATLSPAVITPASQEKPAMSQEKILELIQENANLKADNEVLKMQHKNDLEEIKSLEDEITELENKPAPGFFAGLSEPMQNKIGDLLGAFATKLLAPPPPAIAESSQEQRAVTYPELLHILKTNPQVVEQLRKDLNPQPQPQPAENGQQS